MNVLDQSLAEDNIIRPYCLQNKYLHRPSHRERLPIQISRLKHWLRSCRSRIPKTTETISTMMNGLRRLHNYTHVFLWVFWFSPYYISVSHSCVQHVQLVSVITKRDSLLERCFWVFRYRVPHTSANYTDVKDCCYTWNCLTDRQEGPACDGPVFHVHQNMHQPVLVWQPTRMGSQPDLWTAARLRLREKIATMFYRNCHI